MDSYHIGLLLIVVVSPAIAATAGFLLGRWSIPHGKN